jgi:hypothetical protein
MAALTYRGRLWAGGPPRRLPAHVLAELVSLVPQDALHRTRSASRLWYYVERKLH